MLMYQLLIIMFVGLHVGEDSIIVDRQHGEPLSFTTEQECMAHMKENTDALKAFASSQFDGAPVKMMLCVEVDASDEEKLPQRV